MRITTLLIGIQACFATVLLASPLKAQNINLDVKQANVKQVFNKIEKQANVTFVYNEQMLQDLPNINIKAANKSLEEILKSISSQIPLQFKQSGSVIGVSRQHLKVPAKSPVPNTATQNLQSITVVGEVTDSKGQALAGVTVRVKETRKTTITNAQGIYQIEADSSNTLQFTFVGFRSSEILIKGRSAINVPLMEENSTLDAVQVIGYGTTSKRFSTGNVSSIKADVIGEQPITNPLQALEGRVAGLQVTQGNGLPGSPITVQIRGRNSITASNNPLYVVDGVPFTSVPVERYYGPNSASTAGSPMNSINPADIESISILKDADATSIYGSRGANGVILITTKKGVAGRTKLDVNVNDGAGTITREAQPLNTQQYLQLRRDAFANSGITPTVSNAPDLLSWDQTLDNNLQKWYIGKTAQLLDANASLSGGNELTTFILSGGFHRETTVQSGNDQYRRGDLHANIIHTSPNKKLTVAFSALYSTDNNRLQASYGGGFDLLGVAQSIPNYPIYDAKGNYNWLASQNNYKAEALGYDKSSTNNLNANLSLTYNILSGLDLKGSLGYNRLENKQVAPTPVIAQDPNYYPVSLTGFNNQYTDALLFEPQLTYTRQISKGKLNLLAGATLQKNNTQGASVTDVNFPNDQLLESEAAGMPVYITSNTTVYNYLSVFSRATYNWDDKYIFNGTFRRDGSSRFGPGKQFGNFGSIGGAWLFSNENYLKDKLNWLSFGKLRGSYGSTGSDGIGDYGYLSLYSFGQNYGSTASIYPSQIANSNFQWEVTKKLELALELGFLKDRILLNASWYRNRSSDQLVTYPLPTTTGFSGYIANLPAVVQNTGWEFELNTINIKKGDFSWTSSINLTVPRNKLVSFSNIAKTAYANTLVVGQSLNIVQAYHFLGIDPATGLTNIEDVNKDAAFSSRSSYNGQGGDYVIAGTTDPKLYGGFNNSVIYKGFQLDVFFQYVRQQGYNLYNQKTSTGGFGNFGQLYNFWTDDLDYWKKPGDQTKLPKPLATSNNSLYYFSASDRTFSDASFLRLKSISISYTLPSVLTSKWGLSKLRVYLQGQNVLTVTKFAGYDPELSSNPTTLLPPLKELTAGIQCTF